jgi:hypothetical protein
MSGNVVEALGMAQSGNGRNQAAFVCLLAVLNLLTACGLARGPLPGIDGGQRALVRILVQTSDRSPASGLSVVLKKDATPVGTARVTDGSGVAEFPDVPVGDGYRAFVNGRGFQSGVTESIKVIGAVEVPLQLTPLSATGTGILVGSVKEFAGAPVAGATVAMGNRTVMTNASGQFTFANMPPGRFALQVSKAGFTAANKPDVTVVAGDVSEIETLFLRSVGGSAASIAGGGQYLIATPGRVAEVDRSWNAPWRFTNVGLAASAARLPSGEMAIADSAAKKVVVVDRSGKVLFSLGGAFSKLKSATWVAADKMTGNLLVTDADGGQILELSGRNVTWTSKGPWRNPRSATYTPRGTILVADTGNKAVAEVDRNGNIVWSFAKAMSQPVYAQRLANGNTLITDAGYNRIIEVDPKGTYVWHYDGMGGAAPAPAAVQSFGIRQLVRRFDAPAGAPVTNPDPPAPAPADPADPTDPGNAPPPPPAGLYLPRMATRLANGNTLIADSGNQRVLEVTTGGQTVWEIGNQGRVSMIEKLTDGMAP